jgi:hypothetical protein
MHKRILYRKAYRALEDSTPLKFDCGLLCNSKCCSGDSNSGMCLFPGEEVMFEKHGGFLAIRKETLSDTDVLFAVCNGTCNRKLRPLSCRIFPYVPYLDEGGRLTIIEDPRAKYLCPLLVESFEFEADKVFIRRVLNTFRFLMQDDEIKNHIRLLSGALDEYKRFLR